MSATTKWVTAIVSLLSVNVIAMVILATVATNGTTQVIPAYYDRAVHYDDAIDQAARNRVLGWHATAKLVGGQVAVDVRDPSGAVVRGHVHVTGYQRAHAADKIDVDLAPGADGEYRGTVPSSRAGVHDLTIVVERGGDRFVQQAAIEAR